MAGLAPGPIRSAVMAGPVAAIHVLLAGSMKDVDARDKRGHDSGQVRPRDKPGR